MRFLPEGPFASLDLRWPKGFLVRHRSVLGMFWVVFPLLGSVVSGAQELFKHVS